MIFYFLVIYVTSLSNYFVLVRYVFETDNSLTFIFLDVNEPPTNLNLSNLQVRENMNDTLVGILEISDPDEGQKHDCKIPDSSGFYIDTSVNPQTLRTAKPLDFESSSVEYVNIRCNDIVPGHHQRQFHIERLFKINVIGMVTIHAFKLENIDFDVSLF